MSILLDALLRSAINPALSLLPPRMDSDAARVQMMSIMLQESEGIHRIQIGNGPAHGLWQMEEGGGVHGVMFHSSSRDYARAVCATRHLPYDQHTVWDALARDDILAAAFARLLLWTSFRPLPSVDASDDETWDYYVDLWRPGQPRPEDWPKNHAAARAQVLT